RARALRKRTFRIERGRARQTRGRPAHHSRQSQQYDCRREGSRLMNARVTEPKAGEATVVSMPRAEKSATPPQPEAPAQTVSEAPKKKVSRRLILMIAVPLVLVVAGGYFWLTGGRYEDTD